MPSELELFLQSKGFDIEAIGGYCPFQIEANHRSGISVYFKGRGKTVSLEVYDEHYGVGGLPDADCLIWKGKFQCWEEYKAGWISFSEAFYVFHALWSEARDVVEGLADI